MSRSLLISCLLASTPLYAAETSAQALMAAFAEISKQPAASAPVRAKPAKARLILPEDGEYPSVIPAMRVKSAAKPAAAGKVALLLPDDGEYASVIPTTRLPVAKGKPKPAPALAALSAEQSAALSPAAGQTAASSPASALPPEPVPDPAPKGELLLEEAVSRALDNSPERLIAMAQEGQAKASLREARANYYPQGVYNVSGGREFNDPLANSEGALASSGYNWASSHSVNIRQMLYDGFITRETVAQRMAALESTSRSKSKVNEELIKSTAEAYMQVYQFQHIVAASHENLEALRDILKLVDLRLKGGDASRAELQYMQARVAAAEQSYVTSQASLRDAINALAFIIGDVPDFIAQKPPLDPYLIPNTTDVMQKSLDNNNEIRIARAELKATQHELYAAQGRYMPEVTLVADGAHSDQLGGRTGSRDFGALKVQMSYRFLDGGQREASELKAHQKLNELKAKKERIVREVTQKVRNDLNKQQTALKELQIAENEIVANTELEALYRKQFKSGDIDITNLVESQERIYSARLKKYTLEGDLVNVAFSILKDTSDLLPRLCKGHKSC